MIEAHHFNTYSSVKYSNEKRTLYLGLTKKGASRKVQTRANAPLGKLAAFTNVLTKHVPKARVEELALRMLKGRYFPLRQPVHPMLRHHGHHQLCAYLPFIEPLDTTRLRCHRQKKKKKRKCSEDDPEDCEVPRLTPAEKKRCEDGEEEEECQRRLHMIRKKRKSRTGDGDSKKLDAFHEEMPRRKRLRLEKKRDSSDKSKKLNVKCLNISKSDAQAYNDCVLKKGLRKKLRVEQGLKTAKTAAPTTTSPGDEATEPLLWRDQLGGGVLPPTKSTVVRAVPEESSDIENGLLWKDQLGVSETNTVDTTTSSAITEAPTELVEGDDSNFSDSWTTSSAIVPN